MQSTAVKLVEFFTKAKVAELSHNLPSATERFELRTWEVDDGFRLTRLIVFML